MQAVSVKQTFVMDKEKFIILVQGHECLYNLQHNDYDNNLVKYNCWKEIAGEWQGYGMLCVNWPLQSHYGPGVDSASNRNEYQEYFLGVKAADA
jgi:hypothetical protein